MSINAKKLKSILTLSDYETIEKSLGLREFSHNEHQVIFYNADKYKDLAKQTPKLYRYNDTKNYISYTKSCSYDIIGLVQAIKTTNGEVCSFIDAVNYILTTTGLDPTACKRLTKKKVYDWEEELGKYLRIKHGENSLQIYDRSILHQLYPIYPQEWINEGISIDTMEKYGIGYYPRLQATTIPCFNNIGELIGIRCRHWFTEEINNGKYRPLQLLDGTIYKFPTNNIFYGENYNRPEIERTGHVILVEGEKSVLKADTWWNERSNVLALYGSNIGLKRVRDLVKMGVNHVTLALDSDFHKIGDDDYKLFEQKMIKISKMFQGYCNVDIVYNNIELDWYKCSPFDGDEDVWNEMYERREMIC